MFDVLDAVDVTSLLNTADFDGARRRGSLIDFVSESMRDYDAGWFHKDVCRRLEKFSQDVRDKKSPRLILTAPPRSGKSFMAAERFPVWHMGRNPDHEIIISGYGLSIAQDRSKAARDLALDPYTNTTFPGFRVAKESWAKANWSVDKNFGRGNMTAAGRQGAVTGKGAHVLVLDDLVKDHADALSAVQRDNTWQWYLSTAYTRLAPGGGILIIMTRWHSDDIVGRVLLDQADERWEVVNYPAIAVNDETYRNAGEALHPSRFDLDALLKRKRVLGSRLFESLYQQHPTTPGGSVIKSDWWKFWSNDPSKPNYQNFDPATTNVVASWDLTFKETKKGSFVVGQIWTKRRGKYYLLDQVRGRWGFVETKAQILKLAKKWPKTTKFLIEDKANGPAIIDAFKGTRGIGHKLVPIQPDGSKIARCHAIAGIVESGDAIIPEPSERAFVPGFVEEHALFPDGANDDQVDTLTQSLRYMSKARKIRVGSLA